VAPTLPQTLPAGWYTRTTLRELKPPSWLIEPYLPTASLAQLVGPSQVGKTFLAVTWACALAYRGARVALLLAEGLSGINSRVDAWEEHYERLVPDENLLIRDGASMLIDPVRVSTLGKELKEAGRFDLLIFDTYARFMAGGDENSSKDTSIAVANIISLQRTAGGASALLLHHTGWSGERQRGSSVLYAACDTVLYLKPVKRRSKEEVEAYDEDDYQIEGSPPPTKRCRLTVDKQKDGALVDPTIFERFEVAGTASCVLLPVASKASTNGHGQVQQLKKTLDFS
jgi:AAA domain-containing protein